jgi:hypothetical protein
MALCFSGRYSKEKFLINVNFFQEVKEEKKRKLKEKQKQE